jgi:hypothetical protein
MLKIRSAHLTGVAVLIALAAAPSSWAASASVSGIVRDSTGVPQIGAVVELLRSDLSIAASVHTGSDGRFAIASILPGQYALKAINPTFLPSLRENLRLRSGATVVNLTLSTLYEAMRWLPAEPRGENASQDDWAWTLRSAADRPLLRWLEDGPLVVVSDGTGAAPKLKARILVGDQSGAFGETGERISATVEDTPSDNRELLAHVDVSDEGVESMLGFRQDMGFAGSVESVAAVEIHPEFESQAGLDSSGASPSGLVSPSLVSPGGFIEAGVRSVETMHLGPDITAEVGADAMLGRLGGTNGSGVSGVSTVTRSMPFANVEWRNGNSSVHYRLATMVQNPSSGNSQLPVAQFSARNGSLAIEHGLFQEIGWTRQTNSSGVALAVYAQRVENPVVEAAGRFANIAASTATAGALFDPASGILRAAGVNYSSDGVEASVERRLHGNNWVRVHYAGGSALAAPAQPQSATLPQLVAGFHPRRVQSYSISLSGTVDGTGTKWQASYRWQPDDTVTPVAPYATAALAPYLDMRFDQSLYQSHVGSGAVEGLLEVRNLLAEGYHPYMLNDGSVLFFSQGQRSLRGGLAFTF